MKASETSLPKIARPAATTILLRETDTNPVEVLLLRRSKALSFAAGHWVFPGGRVDPEDFASGVSVEDCNERQLLDAVNCAAVRETFEECGIDISGQQSQVYSHWTTPKQQPKRFSTWFLMVKAPARHDVMVDNSEITQYQWLTPKEAISKQAAGRLLVSPPAYISLLELNRCTNIDEAFAFSSARETPFFQPQLHMQQDKVVIIYNGDAAFNSDELDTQGHRHRLEITGKTYDYQHTLGET